MSKISFHMAGSGNWRKLFPDENTHALYYDVYTEKIFYPELPTIAQTQISEWQKANIVTIENEQVIPLAPIFTDADNLELTAWFRLITEQTTATISSQIGDYRALAHKFATNDNVSEDDLLTILLCAYTLDLGTLLQLESGIMGEPPQRADSGAYFFWGETAQRDLTNYFGVNSYPMLGFTFSMMWSPAIQRTIPAQPSVQLPVFSSDTLQEIEALCNPISRQLASIFVQNIPVLEISLNQCSFNRCHRRDVYCMLFHIGYGLVADVLIEAGLLPAFPTIADNNWGMWLWAE